MRKKKKIELLESKIEILNMQKAELEIKNEVLQFIVDKGTFPVDLVYTGYVRFNYFGESRFYEKEYEIKFISTYGDISYVKFGMLSSHEFNVVDNNALYCIFTIKQSDEPIKWFKLCKEKKVVLEIPSPHEIGNNNNYNTDNNNS